MHTCDKSDADVTIDGRHYKLDSLGECKTLARLRGAKGVEFNDYPFTLTRLEGLHKQEFARRRAERMGA
jgi:hypothetical protein